MNINNQNPGELNDSNQVQNNCSKEIGQLSDFIYECPEEDPVICFQNWIINHSGILSAETQKALFGVDGVANYLGFGSISDAQKVNELLGDVSPEAEYDPSYGCTKEQFFLRKLAYAVFILTCYCDFGTLLERDLPEGWRDLCDITFYHFDWGCNISKEDVLEAIDTIYESLKK